jgi:hypothetical protein
MIQQITAFSPEETAILEQSWRGRQMLAYQQAYGGGYDFCRFFRATDCGGTGWLFLFNATLLICAEGSVPEEEIRTFAEMHLPSASNARQNCSRFWDRSRIIKSCTVQHSS